MSNGLVLLSLLYFVLAMLVLALAIRTAIAPRLKTVLIVAVIGVAILTHHGWQRLAGWPTRAELPDRFLYHAASVREPNAATGDVGLIHLWATELTPEGPAPEPRGYELPYTPEDHKQIQDARERARQQGLPQIGRKGGPRNASNVVSDAKRSAGAANFQLADLPDPSLPEK